MNFMLQIAIIIGVPALLLYSILLFCYAYGKGYAAGFDEADQIWSISLDDEC